jgi:hypothetical protein
MKIDYFTSDSNKTRKMLSIYNMLYFNAIIITQRETRELEARIHKNNPYGSCTD